MSDEQYTSGSAPEYEDQPEPAGGQAVSEPQTQQGSRLAAISRAMVQMHSKYYGKGPTKAKSYWVDDIVFCVLQDIYTPVEHTLIEAGQGEQVAQTRHVFQQAMEIKFRHAVERETDREVIAFFSSTHIGPDLAVEMFFLMPEGGGDE